MIQKIYLLNIIGVLTIVMHGVSFSQELTSMSIDKIETEISQIFEKSIVAGEKLDVNEISETINASLKTGFIDNGLYFESFEDLMAGFKTAIHGIEYQQMIVAKKKITVLSENHVLLTAHGNSSAKSLTVVY